MVIQKQLQFQNLKQLGQNHEFVKLYTYKINKQCQQKR